MNVPQALFLVAVIGVIITMAVFRWMLGIQVLVGVLVVWALYKFSLFLMSSDKLVITPQAAGSGRPQRVRIVSGYAPTPMVTDRVWTTVMPNADNYAPLKKSMNRKGGAQFTYQFWMYIGESSKANIAGRTILMRGDNQPYSWQKVTVDTASLQKALDKVQGTSAQATDAGALIQAIDSVPAASKVRGRSTLVKCPLIRFGDTYDSFVVEVNTLHGPNTVIPMVPETAPDGIDGTVRTNALKLSVNKWVLHTFTFEDHVAITDFEDGIIIRHYVNDLLYHTARIPSALRQNIGDFHLLPSPPHANGEFLPIKDCRIGNVFYYNYAVGPDAVAGTFKQGPPRKLATDLAGLDNELGDPLHLAEYNKLDVYNT